MNPPTTDTNTQAIRTVPKAVGIVTRVGSFSPTAVMAVFVCCGHSNVCRKRGRGGYHIPQNSVRKHRFRKGDSPLILSKAVPYRNRHVCFLLILPSRLSDSRRLSAFSGRPTDVVSKEPASKGGGVLGMRETEPFLSQRHSPGPPVTAPASPSARAP